MKRLLTVSSALALAVSFLAVGGRSYAAHQPAPVGARPTAVRLCASAPLGVPALHHLTQGIFNGVIMATEKWRPAFRAAGVTLEAPLTMDDARSDGVSYDQNHERQNALNCLSKPDTYGYVGTLNSGAAQVSEPILNRGGMVQISPANSGVVLTDPHTRASQEPATYNHTLSYVTYYRVVTTDNLQGPTDATYMRNVLHAKTFFLVDDKSTYGAGLAAAFKAFAPRVGLKMVGSGHIDPTDSSTISTSSDQVSDNIVSKHPDAVFYGGDSETGLILPKDLRQKGYTSPLMGGDAIVNNAWIKGAKRGATNNYATLFGPDVSIVAKTFQNRYVARFHTALDAYDAPSWDAANIELSSILKAIKSGAMGRTSTMLRARASVLPYVATIRWKGAIGTTTFDRNGDTFNRILSVYTVRGSNWSFITVAPRVAVNPTP